MAERRVPALATELGLAPHPEGGWFRRVWTAEAVTDEATGRRAGSAVHYLMEQGDVSAWHRVTDAEELWCHLRGAPVELRRSPDGFGEEVAVLGSNDSAAAVAVPPGCWQSARPLGGWSLVLCTVVPEFVFESFELATPCWEPGAGPPV